MAQKDPISALEKLDHILLAKAVIALNDTGAKCLAKLQREHLAGAGGNSLAKRTGTLGRSMKLIGATLDSGSTILACKIFAGVPYAKAHFGPRGSDFPIFPKKAKMLAIPLAAAKTGAGVARGGPTDGIWGPTVCFKSKAGNLIIWGYQISGKSGRVSMGRGLAQKKVTGGHGKAVSISAAGKMQSQGELVPLFVLKDSVVIKRRIDPQVDVIAYAKPLLIANLKKGGVKVG